MKNWFAGVAVTAGILLVMDTAMANPFDNTVPEDSNLTTVSKSVKLCEGFCNSMTVNQKAWSGGITEVRGFPGAEDERVFRFQAKKGFCGGDYDCSSDAKKWLKRRAEVITKNKIGNGQTHIYKWSMYIPSSQQFTSNDFVRPVQWHGSNNKTSMAIAFGSVNGLTLYTKNMLNHKDSKNTEIYGHNYKDKWLNFEVHFTRHKTEGAIMVAINDKVVFECENCQTNVSNDSKLFFGIGSHANKTWNAVKYDQENTWAYTEHVVFFKDVQMFKVLKNGKLKAYYN